MLHSSVDLRGLSLIKTLNYQFLDVLDRPRVQMITKSESLGWCYVFSQIYNKITELVYIKHLFNSPLQSSQFIIFECKVLNNFLRILCLVCSSFRILNPIIVFYRCTINSPNLNTIGDEHLNKFNQSVTHRATPFQSVWWGFPNHFC